MGSKGLSSSGLLSKLLYRLVLPPLLNNIQSRAKVLARQWITRWALDYVGKIWPGRLATAEAVLKG